MGRQATVRYARDHGDGRTRAMPQDSAIGESGEGKRGGILPWSAVVILVRGWPTRRSTTELRTEGGWHSLVEIGL